MTTTEEAARAKCWACGKVLKVMPPWGEGRPRALFPRHRKTRRDGRLCEGSRDVVESKDYVTEAP